MFNCFFIVNQHACIYKKPRSISWQRRFQLASMLLGAVKGLVFTCLPHYIKASGTWQHNVRRHRLFSWAQNLCKWSGRWRREDRGTWKRLKAGRCGAPAHGFTVLAWLRLHNMVTNITCWLSERSWMCVCLCVWDMKEGGWRAEEGKGMEVREEGSGR